MASYDSDDDEGDALFDHDTIATLPLQPFKSNTQQNINPSKYHTQATQILRTGSPSQIQVQASSPIRSPSPTHVVSQNGHGRYTESPTATARFTASTRPSNAQATQTASEKLLNRGVLAYSMAPPGTAFRAPMNGSQAYSQTARSQTAECNFSDEDTSDLVCDSDEEGGRKILQPSMKPTTFVRNGIPIDRDNEHPKTRFDHFSYNGSAPVTVKRSADAMASAYGERRRKVPRPTGRAEASPKDEKPMKIEDVKDFDVQRKLRDMQAVYPNSSVRQCYAALVKRRFHYEDALEALSEDLEKTEILDTPNSAAELAGRNFKGLVDLTGSEDDQSKRAPKLNPVKRNVVKTKTIQEKWGGPSRPESSRLPGSATGILDKEDDGSELQLEKRQSQQDLPKKRKLIRPKRQPSPLPSSSPVRAPEKRHSTEDFRAIEVSSGDESATESVPPANASEQKLLEFLNTCSTLDLSELSAQPIVLIDQVLSKRPFANLNTVRAVVVEESGSTKTGKARIVKKKVGERLVDVCLEVFESYRIVDELVAHCENLGKPVQDEMKRWGFSAYGQRELEIVDFDHDSGIGTPTSSVSGEREERNNLSKKHSNRLTQPEIMSHDLVMKDYQVTGLNWLALLFSQDMSGILADDMGLGKTCQVISFLAHLLESGKSTGLHLIVVPGSTLENWLREFRNFCPAMTCIPYYGSQKERAELQLSILDRDDLNVVITTYEMATGDKNDTRFLRHLEPVVCVYDEGHALKNCQSKRYQALMRIPAQFRLLLTGTPLQNNLQELISLLAFIMPDVFQDHNEDLSLLFKHKAKTTDDSGRAALLSQERIDRARAMMTPFILRRKKQQVLKHLPRKIARVEYCDLTQGQASIYAKQTEGLRKALLTNKSTAPAKIETNTMMHLRKAAIHPLLFRHHFTDSVLRKMAKTYMQIADDNNVIEELVYEDLTVMSDFELNRMCDQYHRKMSKFKFANSEYLDSGKTAKLVELLQEHKRNGDRTLVFSQFTMVMDILEKVFELEEITYSRIDGSTKMDERQDLIDQYHRDKDILVFMLSTKSGGAGINLTAANKVIIFDQDFNPQTSLQAENRAHRVGQTREVEVIRLITKGTIEEQIHALGDTKLALDQAVAGEGDIDPKQSEAVERDGIEMVERMLVQSLENGGKKDLKDDFLKGLKNAGLDIVAANT